MKTTKIKVLGSLSAIGILLLLFMFMTGCDKEGIPPIVMDQEIELRSNPHPRPLTGSIDLVSYNELDLNLCSALECELFGISRGSGNLTHLGLTTGGTKACADQPVFDPFPNLISYRVYNQSSNYISANGDELCLDLMEPYILEKDTPTSDYRFGTGHFVIVGGTGRFSDASGTVDVEITQYIPTSEVHVEVDGTIIY